MPASLANATAFSKGKGFQQAIWVFMEEPSSSAGAMAYACISPIFVIFTVILAFLSTVPDLSYSIDTLSNLDLLLDSVFAFELLLRLAVCPSKIAFIRNWYNLIDFLGVLPLPFKILTSFQLPGEEGTVLHAAVICIVPALRLLKTTRHYWGFRIRMPGHLVHQDTTTKPSANEWWRDPAYY
jgi:potassium voltage-gated channel Shaker-related subfamily A protein 7